MKVGMAGVLVFVFLLTACQSGQKTDVANEIRDLILTHAQATASGDFETLNQQWYNGEGVSVFEQGGANNSWADYRDNHLKPEVEAFKDFKFSYDNIKIDAGTELAYATMKYKLSGVFKEKEINSGGLETMIFKKINGKWQIVHTHISFSRKSG